MSLPEEQLQLPEGAAQPVKQRRAQKQPSSFGARQITPGGGKVRVGTRGEGANRRKVTKRLELTPQKRHYAEFETCDRGDCKSKKRCDACMKYSRQAVKNARVAKGNQGLSKNERRAQKQPSSFGARQITPGGGKVRVGTRGEGANRRKVTKRLELTPQKRHYAEFETCDRGDCKSKKRCDACMKYSRQAVKNARVAKGNQGLSKNEREERCLFLSSTVLEDDPQARRSQIKRRSAKIQRALNRVQEGGSIYVFGKSTCYVGPYMAKRVKGKWVVGPAKGVLHVGVYEGEHKNGMWHGDGKITNPDGSWTVGSWKQGKKHGRETTYFPGGNLLVKLSYEYVDGVYHGHSTAQFYDGTIRERTFRHGKCENWFETTEDGVFEYLDADSDDEATDSCRVKVTFPCGTSYEGGWDADLYNKTKISPDGMNGLGRMEYLNGDIYVGGWKRGKRQGWGELTCAGGQRHRGLWDKGEMDPRQKKITDYFGTV